MLRPYLYHRGWRMYKLVLFIVLLAVLLVSCSRVDELDSEVRLVVLSPEIAEILAYLGLVNFIVGVTAECDYPEVLQEKEIVGSFGNINIEKVINLRPTLVYTSLLEQAAVAESLTKLQIETVSYYPSSVDDLKKIIEEIASEYGKTDKAFELIEKINLTVKEANSRLKHKPRVYIEIYNNPIMSVSDNSFVGELINIAGGRNIFPRLPRDYSRVRAEDVINYDPEIIIITYPMENVGIVANRKGWENIKAVAEGRIYTPSDIDPDLLLRAGPRLIEGINKLNEIFSK